MASASDEELVEILGHLRRDCADWGPANLGKLGDHLGDVRRLVSTAAMGDGRQVRRIGLGQKPVRWRDSGGTSDRVGTREGHDARERQVKIQVECRPGHRLIAGKAVKHAANPPHSGLAEDSERVVCRLPGVNDDWQAKLNRQPELRPKNCLRVMCN